MNPRRDYRPGFKVCFPNYLLQRWGTNLIVDTNPPANEIDGHERRSTAEREEEHERGKEVGVRFDLLFRSDLHLTLP